MLWLCHLFICMCTAMNTIDFRPHIHLVLISVLSMQQVWSTGAWQEGEASANRPTHTECGAPLVRWIATSVTLLLHRTQTIPRPPRDSRLATPRNESFTACPFHHFVSSLTLLFIVFVPSPPLALTVPCPTVICCSKVMYYLQLQCCSSYHVYSCTRWHVCFAFVFVVLLKMVFQPP